MTRRTVRAAHTASYSDPIEVAAGQSLTQTGRDDVWDCHRWLWAVASDGREGWIPDSLVSPPGTLQTIAAYDYSARELTCETGEELEAERESHGWAWCRAADGRQGWVPLRNLDRPGNTG